MTPEQAAAAMIRIVEGFKQPTPFFMDVSKYMKRQTVKRMMASQDPNMKQFHTLSPVTLVQPGRTTNLPLLRTLLLMRSFQSVIEKGPGYSAVKVFTRRPWSWVHTYGTSMRVTPKQSIWMWHNLGMNKPPGSILTIPQREFLGFSNEDVTKVGRKCISWIRKVLRTAIMGI